MPKRRMAELRISTNDLVLPIDAVTRTMAILATKDAGKTYLGGVLAEEMLKAGAQIVVLDPVGRWYGLRLGPDGTGVGYPITIFGGQRGDLPLDASAGRFMAKLIVERGICAILDVSMMRKADRRRFAADFAEELFELKKVDSSPLHLFLEEAHSFIPQIQRKDDAGAARMTGAFEDIATIGRNFGLGLTMISQRPAAVAKAALNVSEAVFALRTMGRHERKALEEWMVESGLEGGEPMLADVAGLPKGTAYLWSPGWLRIARKIAIRTKRTFDSSATPKVGEKRRAPTKLSTIDIEAIRTQMAEVVERVEAEDPAKLRTKVAELERQLKRAMAAVPESVPTITNAAGSAAIQKMAGRISRLQRALEQAMKVLITINMKGFATEDGVKAATRAEIEKALSGAVDTVTRMVEKRLDARADELARFKASAERAVKGIEAALGEDLSVHVDVKRTKPFDVQAVPTKEPAAVHVASRRQAGVTAPNGAKLGRCELRIISALQAHGPQNSVDLGILTVYAHSGGAFLRALGVMRTANLISGSNSAPMELTPDGHRVGRVELTPPRGAPLMTAWLGQLGKAERTIIEAVAKMGGTSNSPAEIAAHGSYEATGGAFLRAMGVLRGLAVISGGLRGSPVVLHRYFQDEEA